jgi:hypothetical protein
VAGGSAAIDGTAVDRLASSRSRFIILDDRPRAPKYPEVYARNRLTPAQRQRIFVPLS